MKESIYKLCHYSGIDFKDQIFISSLDIKNNLANAYVDINGSITNFICKFQINKEYICSTVFIDDGLSWSIILSIFAIFKYGYQFRNYCSFFWFSFSMVFKKQ